MLHRHGFFRAPSSSSFVFCSRGGARYLLNMWRSTGAAVCSVTFFFPRVCHRCRTSGTGNLCRTEPHKRGLAHMEMLARRPNHKVTQIHPNIYMNSGSRENSSAAVQRVWWFRSFSQGKVALSCRNLERSLGDTSDSAAAHFHCFPLPVLFSFLMDKPRIHKDVFFFFSSMEAIHQIFLSIPQFLHLHVLACTSKSQVHYD